MAIKRIWHGWTTPENADVYQALLHTDVLPNIEAMDIAGYRGVEVLRRNLAEEVEFVTIMIFDDLDSVIRFKGADYEQCYVPDAAQRVLKRWDKLSTHFEIVETRPSI